MNYNTEYISQLYNLAAELGYFKANITKKNDAEVARIGRELHLYCQENKVPVEVFGITLENRVIEQRKQVKQIEQKAQIYRTGQRKPTKRTNKQKRPRRISDPFYKYYEEDDDLLFYEDPGPGSDCADWNDDWDGTKY